MKKKTDITIKVDPKLEALAEEAIFIPSSSQKKAKYRFLEKWDGVTEPTAQLVMSLTGQTMVRRWWNQNGFREWLVNAESVVSKVNYLTSLALDRAEEVLLDEDAGASSHVNMIKVILGFKHVLEQKNQGTNPYAHMSKEDLVKLIKKETTKLGPVIDAED